MSIGILFCVTLIIYTLIRCLPSSYVETMAMQLSSAPGAKSYDEWIAQLNASYGLDQPILVGYVTWLKDFLQGNFGDSWKWTMPVMEKFQSVIGLSFVVGAISLVLQLIIAIPLGIIAATKQYSKADYAITAGALVGISLPTFFFATLLKLGFAVKLGWFDTHGLVGRNYAQLDAMGQLLDKANHLVLPIATLTIISIGSLMRYTRTNMLEVLNADYIRTARAKGIDENAVVMDHAFPNALIPTITVIGVQFGNLLGGAILVETVFAWPGLGRLMVQSVNNRDVPLVLGCIVILSISYSVVNLLVDLVYGFVDPRVRSMYK